MKLSREAYALNLEACIGGLEEYIKKQPSKGEKETAYDQLSILLQSNKSSIDDDQVNAVKSHLLATPDPDDKDQHNDERKVATEALVLVILKPFLDKKTFETIEKKLLNQEPIKEISIDKSNTALQPHHLIALQALFESITLENLSLSKNTVKTLAGIIEKNNPLLKTLVLKIRDINALDLTNLATALEKNTGLETLHIENVPFNENIETGFTQKNMTAIAKSLSSNEGLKSVAVQSAEILDDDFYIPINDALANIFDKNHTIGNVKFDDNEMSRPQHTLKH